MHEVTNSTEISRIMADSISSMLAFYISQLERERIVVCTWGGGMGGGGGEVGDLVSALCSQL